MAKWLDRDGPKYVYDGDKWNLIWCLNTRLDRKLTRQYISQMREEFPSWAAQMQAKLDAVDKRRKGGAK